MGWAQLPRTKMLVLEYDSLSPKPATARAHFQCTVARERSQPSSPRVERDTPVCAEVSPMRRVSVLPELNTLVLELTRKSRKRE